MTLFELDDLRIAYGDVTVLEAERLEREEVSAAYSGRDEEALVGAMDCIASYKRLCI